MTRRVKSVNGQAMKPFLIALITAGLLLPTFAGAAIPIADFAVCLAHDDRPPARFDGPGCQRVPFSGLDPQARDLWVQTHADVSKAALDGGPLGLYISAKAASTVYLNGEHLGRNGTPASSRAGETPGRMDVVFPIPPDRLREGRNEIVLRLSSFHNTVRLSHPVHMIAIAPLSDPLDVLLRAYWPSLVTFGVLLAGAFFFASSAISGVNRRDPLLLALLSMLAAGQLFAEVYRGLSPYPYPVQDWRLITIMGLSTVFSMTLITLTALRFPTPRPRVIFAAGAVFTLTPLFAFPGFDGKAAFALLAAALASGAIAGRAALKGDRTALASCLALVAFAGSILLFQGRFLDTVFFYEVAAVILVLFTVRAFMFERERREHEKTQMRSHDLELALERATQAKTPTVLRINSAGAVNIVNTTDIILCKGADDYVELHLADGRWLLHNGSLADLENDLPASFLRVHRSYIVNTGFVEKLTREATGIGVLTLSNGAQAPVSRRIMPKVRSALA